MDSKTTRRTEELGPILRLLKAERPNWKDISCRILVYFGFEELSYTLTQRRQDWQAIAESLLPALKEDPNYQRVAKILESLPGTLEEIGSKSGYHFMTVSQTLNALERSGHSFDVSFQGDKEGRPIKVFEQC